MKFRDGCTAVVSPGVGVWGVQAGFPGFQGASKGLPLALQIHQSVIRRLTLILDPPLSQLLNILCRNQGRKRR